MDLSTRMPSYYREKELALRAYVTSRLTRGKVDVLLYSETSDADNSHDINRDTVRSYIDQLRAIEPSVSPSLYDFTRFYLCSERL